MGQRMHVVFSNQAPLFTATVTSLTHLGQWQQTGQAAQSGGWSVAAAAC